MFYRDELSRTDRYLMWDEIKQGILREFRTEMLLKHTTSLFERATGLRYLFSHDKQEDLSLLYTLYQEHPDSVQLIANAFKEHLTDQGLALLAKLDLSQVVEKESEHSKIKEALSQSHFIEKLVQMLDKYQGMVRNCFRGSPVLERARQTAFETFLNKDRDEALKNQKASISEVIAIYTDTVLRKGGLKLVVEAGANEEEYLRQLVQLFTHLVDKDLFIEVYRSYLAKRLLNEKSQSVEQERQMISFIKLQSGPQFTKKLEGMLNDLAIATEQSKLYEAAQASSAEGGVEFHVTILTSSHWPSYKNFPDLQVPRVLSPAMESFTQYYQGRNNHRLVKWCFSLGTATVAARFQARTFDLVVGTF